MTIMGESSGFQPTQTPTQRSPTQKLRKTSRKQLFWYQFKCFKEPKSWNNEIQGQGICMKIQKIHKLHEIHAKYILKFNVACLF